MSTKKERMRIKKIQRICVFSAIAVIILLAAGLGLSIALNHHSIELNIADGETVYIEYGDSYDDSDIIALYKGTIWNRKGTKIDPTCEGTVDVSTLGEYVLTYTASYKGLTASATRTVIVEDAVAPVISLVSDPDTYTNPNDSYIEEGYSATDNYDGDLTDQVIREEKDGVVTYTVTDTFGNTTSVTREIVYKDLVSPVIQLAGDSDLTIEGGSDFSDPGYQATDDCDGDLTGQVQVTGSVDTHILGDYELTYTVTDSSENTCTVTRNVHVTDTTAPSISLNGNSRVYVPKGESYTDEGASAEDALEGDLSASVQTVNPVDSNTVGVYTVKYSVSDSSGNAANTTRTVYVYEKQAEITTVIPDEKVVYLTFDDGPGKYTQKLLDILDKYNVKATFFVTNQYPDYQDLIGEEYRRGHTVAIHSYSHDYSDIYSSEEAFYQDIEKMNNIIFEQTGVRATILRFPGGSSNTISKRYSTGIMTALTESVEIMGYQYADWNVLSGDAGDTTSTSKVVSNVINGIKKHDASVVLQHDIHGFSVDAVEEIVVWGLANGYTFLPMDETSPMAHHGVNN